MKQYVVVFDGGYQYEETSDYIIANEQNLNGIIDSIKHGWEIDKPHNIHIYEISEEVTNKFDTKTKYDQEDMTPFNVIYQDFNTTEFAAYDIMPYFIRAWENLDKSTKKEIKTLDDLREWFIKESKYMFWSRCQYEVVLQGWPNTDNTKKIDIHWQIMMNIDLIVKIFAENIRFKEK